MHSSNNYVFCQSQGLLERAEGKGERERVRGDGGLCM